MPLMWSRGAVGEALLVIDPEMAEARDVEIVLGEVVIGIDHGIQRYLGVYDGRHGCSRGARPHLRIDAAVPHA